MHEIWRKCERSKDKMVLDFGTSIAVSWTLHVKEKNYETYFWCGCVVGGVSVMAKVRVKL